MTFETKIYRFLNMLDENEYHTQYDIINDIVDPFLESFYHNDEKIAILKMFDGACSFVFTPEELKLLEVDKLLQELKEDTVFSILTKESIEEIFKEDRTFNEITIDLLLAINEKDPKIFDPNIPQIGKPTVPPPIITSKRNSKLERHEFQHVCFKNLWLYILTDILGNHFNYDNFHFVIKELLNVRKTFKEPIQYNMKKYLNSIIYNITSNRKSKLKTNIQNIVNVIAHISRSIMLEIFNAIPEEYAISCHHDHVVVKRATVDISGLPYSEYLITY